MVGSSNPLTRSNPCAKKRNMSLDPKLLEILACPVCKKAVVLNPEGTGLLCRECHRVFPIENDIPVMLVEEARPEDEPRESP